MTDFKHDYFIIESLTPEDINDGKIFSDALKTIKGYAPTIRDVKSIEDFKNALVEFSKSNYKYLFISAHGDEENIKLVNEDFNAYDIEDIEINLENRRIFMSTCRGGSFLLSKYFIKKGAYSVIGSPKDLSQIVATGMWVTMAYLFEQNNDGVLDYRELNKTLKLITRLYKIRLNYYSFIRGKNKMKEYSYIFGKRRKRKDYSI